MLIVSILNYTSFLSHHSSCETVSLVTPSPGEKYESEKRKTNKRKKDHRKRGTEKEQKTTIKTFKRNNNNKKQL